MQISTYTLTNGQMQQIANQVKELLLAHLEVEGVISDSKRLCETYAIVVTKKGWLGSFMDKVLRRTGDETKLVVVRVLSLDAKASEFPSIIGD